jgi:hypothetical protein
MTGVLALSVGACKDSTDIGNPEEGSQTEPSNPVKHPNENQNGRSLVSKDLEGERIRLEALPASSVAMFTKGEAEFKEFYSALENEQERVSALTAVKQSSFQAKKMFANLVNGLAKNSSRNSLKEDLLDSISHNEGPKKAADFVFEQNGVGHQRTHELRSVYANWLAKSPKEAMMHVQTLTFPEDVGAFERALASYKDKVKIGDFEAGRDLKLQKSIVSQLANYTIQNALTNQGKEAALNLLNEDPTLRNHLKDELLKKIN